MNRNRFFAVIFSLLLAAASLPLRAASDAEAGRALVKRYADAIVGVELVVTVKFKMGDREAPPREQRIEVNGTIISAGGLTVTSLAQVDPQVQFDSIRAGQSGGRGPELVGTDFKEVKLRLADGSEVPAKFVLKDADLDLAFMMPDESVEGTKRTFPFVKLADATEGAVLGSYFYVARAPKILQRVPLIRATEITGIVEKPRRFYLMTDQSLGSPVFDPQGQLLGITVQHLASGRQIAIVLPAGDVAEMAKQVVAAAAK